MMDDPLYLDNSENNQNQDQEFDILQNNNSLNNMESTDVLDQLLQGVIPPYLPPVNEFSKVNSMIFTCQECSDKFVLDASLVHHLNRRSVLISLRCPFCRQTLEFYNRCRFLEHFRCQHPTTSIRDLSDDIITLHPLPLDSVVKHNTSSLNSLPSKVSPALLSTSSKQISTSVTIKNVSPHGNPNNTIFFPNKSSNAPSTSANHLETNVKMETGVTFPSGSTCLECGEKVNQMQSHYIGSNMPGTSEECCPECSLVLPTKCSLAAHLRTHSMKRPFICPDCARRFSDWNGFFHHLKTECCHFAKSVAFYCPSCHQLFKTSVPLEAHLVTNHVKNVYKCNACSIACFSIEGLIDHKTKNHQTDSGPINPYQQCQLCPDRIIPKSQILFHITAHCKDKNTKKYAYHCLTCKLLTLKKSEFANHLPCEPAPPPPEPEEKKPELMKCFGCGKRLLYSVPPPENQRFIPRCNQCIKETTVVIKNRNGKDILFLKRASDPEKLIRLPKQEQEMLISVNEKLPQNKYYTCHVCKSDLPMEWKKIQTHYMVNHPESNVLLLNGLNGTSTSTSSNQVQSKSNSTRRIQDNSASGLLHEGDIKEEISTIIPKGIPKKIKLTQVINSNNKRPDHGQSLPAKKRKRSISDQPSPEEEPFSSGQILKTTNSRKNSTSNGTAKKKHVCARCGHSEKDLKRFRLHTAKHRDPNSPFLCLECGTSFVVKPSFAKHLHVAHRIRDFEGYLRIHGLKGSGLVEEASPTSIDQYECRVCHEYMGSKELAKHLKVHGLGFLRMRGARGSAASSDPSGTK